MGKTYTTAQGDKWDAIAYAQLGDAAYSDKLMKLNRQYLGYYTFPAGVILELPEITEDTPDTLPPWYQVAE